MICPFMSGVSRIVQCEGEECALWQKERMQFADMWQQPKSGCSARLASDALVGIEKELSGPLPANVHITGSDIGL